MASREWTQGNDAGPHQAPVTKLVLHTTEGSTIEGACASYKVNNSWPHQTVDARFGHDYKICGHLTLDVAARALKNAKGGVDTNTAGVIQVEVVGFSNDPGEVDWAWIGSEIVGPICRETGIPVQSSVPWVEYPDSYGLEAIQRLTGPEWDAYAGILGHQHVPENAHGDPGAIPIDVLLAAATPLDPEEDMPLNASDLNAIESIVAKYTRGTLALIVAGDERPTEWYSADGVTKQEVTASEAAGLVALGLARYWGDLTQAFVVPQEYVDGLPTTGPDSPDV